MRSKVVEPLCYQVYIPRCYLELLLALGAVFSTNDPDSKIPSLWYVKDSKIW